LEKKFEGRTPGFSDEVSCDELGIPYIPVDGNVTKLFFFVADGGGKVSQCPPLQLNPKKLNPLQLNPKSWNPL
jgi:hypothetical protein